MGQRVLDNRALMFGSLLVFDSLHLIWAAMLGRFEMNSITAGFWVISSATVMVGAYLMWNRSLDWSVLFDHFLFFLAVGLLVGGSTWMSYEGVRWVDPGTAGLLSRTSSLFALIFGFVWLGDRLKRFETVGMIISFVGVLIISFQPGDLLRLGSLIVVSSSFTYALHAAVVKRYGDGLDFWNFFFFRVLMTSVAMGVMMFAAGQPAFPSTGVSWGGVFVVGLFDVVVSRTLYYYALRKVTMSYHTIILMLSPVVTIGFAWLFFRQFPTVQALIGGSIVIAGLMIVNGWPYSKSAPERVAHPSE